jgi:hypothetical protein
VLRLAFHSGSVLLLVAASPTQAPANPPSPAALAAEATSAIQRFAKLAGEQRMLGQRRLALERLRDWYAPTDIGVAATLAERREWRDAGTVEQRRTVVAAWSALATQLGERHRALGQHLIAGDDLRAGAAQFRRCLDWLPDDVAAHAALGHEAFEGTYGTPEDIAFARRYRTLLEKAKELAKQPMVTQPLSPAAIPAEIRAATFAVGGAESGSWHIWTSSKNPEPIAQNLAAQAARARDLVAFVLPDADERRASLAEERRVRWLLVLRSEAEWRQFFAANPQLLATHSGKVPTESWFQFESSTGPAAVFWHTPSIDNDFVIAHVTMWSTAARGNEGLGQGLVHAMTALLNGTMLTWFGDVPPTSASPSPPASRNALQWLRRLREQIDTGSDVPLLQVPRERLTSFREDVRLKSWSFVTWLIARYPETWAKALLAIDSRTRPLPEDVDRELVKALGRNAGQLEADWRAFVRGDTALWRALLPKR